MPTVVTTTTTFGPPDSAAYRKLTSAGLDVVVNPYGRRPTEAETIALLVGAVGVIAGTGPMTAEVFDASPDLAVVSRVGIGLDSVDLPAAEDAQVSVFTTPDAVTPAVAELAIGLMLATLRRIPEADRSIRTGSWTPLMGSLLATKTVGVVGHGRIGARVAELVAAFGATVLCSDPVATSERWPMTELTDLVCEADIVTLHVPLVESTAGLMSASRIASMRPGAILINAARGGLVDEDTLAAALGSGALAGAGIDCFDKEPYAGPLADLPNVVLTAHMGSYAIESRNRMEDEAVDNLLRGLETAGIL